MNYKLVLAVFISAALVSAALYLATTSEVIRWQSKGIKIHKQQTIDKTTEGKAQQPWLTDNPYVLALKVWIELCSNLIALLVCTASGAKLLLRKRE